MAGPKIPGSLSDDLGKLLSDNLDSRAVPLAKEAYKTVEAAGIFNKTVDTKTPNVAADNIGDLSVGLDELLAGFKEPKSIEGSGVMSPVSKDKYGVPKSYDKSTGLLMGDEAGKYSPERLNPRTEQYPLTPRSGEQTAFNIKQENSNINDEHVADEIVNPNQVKMFARKGPFDPYSAAENIPGLGVLGAAGVGVAALAGTSAQAKERPLEEELQLDLGGSRAADSILPGSIPNKDNISLLAPTRQSESAIEKKRIDNNKAYIQRNSNIIEQEVAKFGELLVNKAGEGVEAVKQTYGEYQMQKDSLDIKSASLIVQWENETGKSANLSEMDKELFRSVTGALYGEGLAVPINAAAIVPQVTSMVLRKIKANAIDPLMALIRAGNKILQEPQRAALREAAPSLAILHETAIYPLIGSTGWNLGEKGADTDPTTLDPAVQKLLGDKSALVGTTAGAVMLSAVVGYRDLPVWLIGGSSKAGLMLGGMASAAMKQDGDLLTEGMASVVFGAGVQKIAGTELAGKGLNLLGKAKDEAVFRFGEAISDVSMNKFTAQRVMEPLLFMSDSTATRMADEAVTKAQVIPSKFKDPLTKPQAVMLDVGEDGIPRVFGVVDGRYEELGEDLGHIGDDGKSAPVILSSRARKMWVELEPLRNRFYELISKDVKPTRANDFGDWTSDLIPPENPALVFAWKNKDEGGMLQVYRAGSNEFNAELLKSRSLSVVHYDGPNGEPATGLGFLSATGNVIAPDPSEGIPGAITKDLIFRRSRMEGMTSSPIPASSQAWEVHPIDSDDTLIAISKTIKQGNIGKIEGEAEIARGGAFANGISLKPSSAPFDNLPDQPGNKTVNIRGPVVNEVEFNFLPFGKQVLAATLGKATTKLNNAAGRAGLIGDTAWGETFKTDASIQAFSLRHFKRYVSDMDGQLNKAFESSRGSTPQEKLQFNEDLKAYIEGIGHTKGQTARPPSQLAPALQVKVNKYISERNADYDMIKMLGGDVPATPDVGLNPKLEKLFALDYLTEGEWLARNKNNQHVTSSLIGLMQQPKGSNLGKSVRKGDYSNLPDEYDDALGRLGITREMSVDYMKRKRDVTQLLYMKELADNPQASSSEPTAALGHETLVNVQGAGMLKGKYVAKETYEAIITNPENQKVLQNNMLGIINMIKFNKTVLNPMTWGKNIMGNVWGVMNSNIVPTWKMAYSMPKGVARMSKDLKAYNEDMMSSSSSVQRVHETLKYGLLGAEFEASKTDMLDVLDNLATARDKTWSEKIMSTMLKTRDNTVGALGNAYSKVDMATKYGLYVNGLERWGIDLDTNRLAVNGGRFASGDLLGHSTVNFIPDDVITDMIKREVVRRIHLSLPMVDRIGTIATGLSKASPITNPWLRTASELMRVTLQMPYRMANEKGYFTNALGTAAAVGTVLGLNKALRMSSGISDEKVNDAWAIAPDNIKRYMPGGTATMFRASDGGIVFIDLADTLIEPLQWFKGGESDTMPQRFGANMIDMVFGGGLLQDQSKQAQAALGLIDEPQSYNKPFWKQNDTARAITDIGVRLGPQIMSNAWQLYNTANLPPRKTFKGTEELRQPMEIQVLRAIGLDVASLGVKEQQKYKRKILDAEVTSLNKEIKSINKQTEGSATGPYQPVLNKKEAKDKIRAERIEIRKEKIDLRKRKPVNAP